MTTEINWEMKVTGREKQRAEHLRELQPGLGAGEILRPVLSLGRDLATLEGQSLLFLPCFHDLMVPGRLILTSRSEASSKQPGNALQVGHYCLINNSKYFTIDDNDTRWPFGGVGAAEHLATSACESQQ